MWIDYTGVRSERQILRRTLTDTFFALMHERPIEPNRP